jgi:hypothetical protein
MLPKLRAFIDHVKRHQPFGKAPVPKAKRTGAG